MQLTATKKAKANLHPQKNEGNNEGKMLIILHFCCHKYKVIKKLISRIQSNPRG